jgi:hypothetical protein
MARPRGRSFRLFTPLRGLAALFAAVAWIAAGLLGAALAVVLAATVLVLAFMSSVVLALAAVGVKARGAVRSPHDDGLIEARRVGGHSWVAYGWDRDF